MDNVTYLSFPNQCQLIEQPRVAKLNNTAKRPILHAHYVSELEKMMQQVVQNVAGHKPISEVRNERADLAVNNAEFSKLLFSNNNTDKNKIKVNNAEFSEVLFPSTGNSIGTRKLKVNEMVMEKTKKRYKVAQASFVNETIAPVVEKPVENVQPPISQEIQRPVTPEVHVEPVTPPLEESRMSRLYRTGEMPTVQNEPFEEKRKPVSDVINTPARFGGESNPLYEAAHALVNDEQIVNNSLASKIEVGEESKKLDRINAVSHGDAMYDEITSETAKLQEEISVIRERNKELDNKIIDIEQLYAATEKRIKEKEAALKKNELQKAKKAYTQAQEEKLSKTNTYKDLATKLRELQLREAQIDQLANSSDDDYSHGIGRVA